jgi:multimeric flavodoxin WrbA
MQILGIYGSPRKKGNSDVLLDTLLEAAAQGGASIDKAYARKLKIHGCLECQGCEKEGICVIRDDMDKVYGQLGKADVVVVSTPIFFYNVPSELKALIDRSQACWSRRLLKKQGAALKTYDSGSGYLLAVGATRGKNLFEGTELTARYFFDALDKKYKGGLFFREVEHAGDIAKHPEALEKARALGSALARGESPLMESTLK